MFCSPSHRQRSYEARRRADAFQLPTGQLIVAEDDLRRLHDRLYELEAAVDDVQQDVADRSGVTAYRRALEHLLAVANDLVGVVIEPVRD